MDIRPDSDNEPAPIPLTIITLPPLAPEPPPDVPAIPKSTPRPSSRRIASVIVSGVALFLIIVTLFAKTPLGAATQSLAPWDTQHQIVVVPTPTPSRPIVSGPHDFICAALPFAQLAQRAITSGPRAQPHTWYLSVILAQWGIEQAWHMPSYTGYNFGNVSAIAGQPYVSGLNVPGSPWAFAYAPTAEQGVADYVLFVQDGHYAAVSAAYPEGPIAQAQALGASDWDAAHYTSSGHPGSSLITAIATYNLTAYDQNPTTC